ncbi:MAG: CaiB/BaiF CoA transferase family protein [Armatimonadota bacterium]
MMTDRKAALAGVRVLDVSQVMAGPYCAMLLADMGADVIKIEPPEGDSSRRLGAGDEVETPSFWAVNRNKRDIVLNLKDPRGVEIAQRLAARADIFVENYRPGTLERLGLGYERLRTINPALVYASVSGYGQTGPFAQRGGFDLVAQGESGLMSVTGEVDGAPVKCGIPVCDLGAGLFITYAILSAYIHRLRTGEGQHVDTSLLEAGIALSVWEATEYFVTGRAPQPTGSAHRLTAPYQAFRCADGYITVGAATQRTWERMCKVMGLEALVHRREYATDAARVRHRRTLANAVEAVTAQQPRSHWIRALEEAGVPSGAIHTYPEVFAQPHVIARAMLQEVDHPVGGRIKQIGPAVKCSATPAVIRRAAPLLGEHTGEILAEHGYPPDQIDVLTREGVIRQCPSPSQ